MVLETSSRLKRRQRLTERSMQVTNMFSRSPMDWNMTRFSGIPANAYAMQNTFPLYVLGVL